jgi:hypothetical protein
MLNIVKAIKAIFNRPSDSSPEIVNAPIVVQFDRDTYIAKHLKDVQEKAQKLIDIYGSDFNGFFYRPGIEGVIKNELLPILDPEGPSHNYLDNNYWREKHPFNFPGPFYTGESDTCATGDSEAPANVMYDSYTREYVFKQPQSFAELVCVIDAAAVEVFDSYSCNGNSYWTYDRCRYWWQSKPYLLEQLKDPEVISSNGGRVQLYADYLNSDAETDLRRYCFFLENGYYPSGNVTLPDL